MSEKTIQKYLTDFLDYAEIERGLSVKTQENYTRFLNKFFNWLNDNNLSTLSPSKLTTDHIWKYRVFLSRHIDPKKKTTLKKSTQNYYLIALRSLLEFFVEKNIQCIPPSKIKLAKDKSEKEVKFLTLDQLEKLFAAPKTDTSGGLRDKAILEVFFSTGLRISELTNLNREDIKIKNNTTELELAVTGKGDKVRTVYFSKKSVEALKA